MRRIDSVVSSEKRFSCSLDGSITRYEREEIVMETNNEKKMENEKRREKYAGRERTEKERVVIVVY